MKRGSAIDSPNAPRKFNSFHRHNHCQIENTNLDMNPPSIAQQRGMAYAHIPFAIISFFSSAYVIYYLLCKQRQKLKRLYHRLVLTMNFALLLFSAVWVWRPFAVPEGTPHFVAASGSIQTCSASGFMLLMFAFAVPIYYSSLSLQALVAMRHNFKEDNYRWIEKYIHLFAWCFPCAIATVFVATENLNPVGSGCHVGKYPPGCESNPDVSCQRGEDTHGFDAILGLGIIALYFVFTPAVIATIYYQIGKTEKRINGSRGMNKMRESSRKQMMRSALVQLSVYLFSFMLTWVLPSILMVRYLITKEVIYDLHILANSLHAIQGLVFAAVYFILQRLGERRVILHLPPNASPTTGQLTVADIRASARMKIEKSSGDINGHSSRESISFSIFDGVPDEDSPWAIFINASDEDEEDDGNISAAPDERECVLDQNV